MLEHIATLVSTIISTLGYPGLVFVMFAENVFPPIPSEAIMPFAGFLVTRGEFNLVGAIVAGVTGSLLGAFALYWVGYTFSGPKVRGFVVHYGKWLSITESDLDAAEHYFNRFGSWAVLIARVIPLVRSLISVPAGFVRMPLAQFSLLTILGTAVWAAFLTLVGYVLGENWTLIGPVLQKFEHLVLFGLVVALAGVVFLRCKQLSKRGASQVRPG